MNLGNAERVWAVPAIHSATDKLTTIHDEILEHLGPGDRIVYLGNFTGYGDQAVACMDELLAFRRLVLSMRGMIPSDVVYLRGAQEEMLQKLLQLQFAQNPSDVLLWMLGNGLSPTLTSYGISPHDGIEACRMGTMSITKWTHSIREAIRKHGGHETLLNQTQRAAFTPLEADSPLLFVHAGINAHKPLDDQGDSLWWDGDNFESIHARYDPFHKVVRGYDPAHKGMHLNCVTATLDDGCGFGGELICAGFENGQVAQILGQ